MARAPRGKASEIWQERLTRFEESGLSVGAFRAQEGVSPASFYLWRKKLRPSRPQPRPAFQAVRITPAEAVLSIELPRRYPHPSSRRSHRLGLCPRAGAGGVGPRRVNGAGVMLTLSADLSIFVHTRPTDLRKGFDGLSGLVRSESGADPLEGSLFLFFNRRRDRLKILHFDGTGYWLYYKPPEAGTFEEISGEGPCAQIDATQLAMLLSGVSLQTSQHRRKRYRRPSDNK